MKNGVSTFAVMSMAACLGFSVTACSKQEPPKPIVSDNGRPETRSVEAANAIGYNGTAMRKKLDKALDANDAEAKKMDQAASQ